MRVPAVVAVVVMAVGLGGLGLAGCVSSSDDLDGVPVEPPDDDEVPPPPGSATCAPDQHACGRTCVTDQPNNPATGCSLGCGNPCEAPEGAVATCSTSGTCDFVCDAGYALVGDACTPFACESAGYTCGTYTDQAGTVFECGSCVDGTGCGPTHQCAVARDAYESNDVRGDARALGDFDDLGDQNRWVDRLSISSLVDEDWFTARIVDGTDGGNPDVTIQLTNRLDQLGWLDSRHELTVWFQCDSTDTGTSVRCGEWYTTTDTNGATDPGLGIGCQVDATYLVWADIAPSCSGISDSGTATIRIRKTAAPRGDTYDLFVGVE